MQNLNQIPQNNCTGPMCTQAMSDTLSPVYKCVQILGAGYKDDSHLENSISEDEDSEQTPGNIGPASDHVLWTCPVLVDGQTKFIWSKQ